MLGWMKDSRLPTVLAVTGALLLVVSMISIEDITKLDLSYAPPIHWLPFALGLALILCSLCLAVGERFNLFPSLSLLRCVRRTKSGFAVTLRHAMLEVSFGRLEDTYAPSPDWLVVLPANSAFDDKCIQDRRSALGSFVARFFPDDIPEILRMTHKAAETLASSKVSHDLEVGDCVYFERPFGSQVRMAFAAVTTIDARDGITCEVGNVLRAVHGIHQLANRERLGQITAPLFGAGHGGIRPQISLLTMLLGFADAIQKTSGHHLRHIHIVVFADRSSSKAQVRQAVVRRMLAFVHRQWREELSG